MYEIREVRSSALPAIVEARGNLRKIIGYAAVFNSPSQAMPMGKTDRRFVEVIRPGAFAQSIRERADVVAKFNHDGPPLGRVSNGTLRLVEDVRGLRYEIDPPDTQHARDVITMIERRDVIFSSFSFRVRSGGETWRQDKRDSKLMHRELSAVELLDVSPVDQPAYLGTEASVRSMDVVLRSFEEWEAQRLPTLAEMRLRLAEAV